MKRKVWLSLCIIFTLASNACVTPLDGGASMEVDIPEDQDTLLLTPDFSYAAEEQIPFIRIDTVGYLLESRKTAYFFGENMEEDFAVISEDTGETVYEGTLSAVTSGGKNEKMMYTGDFTDIKAAGEYRIFQKTLGYSYPFCIGDTVYQNISDHLYDTIEQNSVELIDAMSYIMSNLMMTQEIFPGQERTDVYAYLTEMIAQYLEVQNQETGAFGLSMVLKNANSISLNATADAAGVLAQYAYLYQDQDAAFATKCVLAAQKAYKYMIQYRDNIPADSWYYAAVQLYRATGNVQYRTAIGEYDFLEESQRRASDQDYTLLADMAYLLTTNRTDFDRCNTIMQKYMDEAQKISTNSSRENFYVLKNIDTIKEKSLLRDMMILGVVNYVLSGREYAGIQENYIHYFFGVNSQARNRLTKRYENGYREEPLEKNMIRISELLFVLGNFSSNK